MKYSVGDKVLLLHSNETGEVVEIMSEEMVMVNVEGVEFPVYTDQIDFPYFKIFSEQSKKAKEKSIQKKVYIDQIPVEKSEFKTQAGKGVYLFFFPVYDTSLYEDNILYYKLYLVNQNTASYQFTYTVFYKDGNDFEIHNTLLSKGDFYLHNLRQEELNDITRYQFQFSLTEPNKKKAASLEVPLKIKPKVLFQKIDEMHLQNAPSFSFEIFTEFPDKLEPAYFPLPESVSFKQTNTQLQKEKVQSVIDLHIEKLIDSKANLSNYEILQIQLNYFEKYYRLAVQAMQPKLIVIHGVGSGKLREEIHERLKAKKEVKSFTNQYHPNFGFGATEIYLQY